MATKKRSWEKRLKGEPDKLAINFVESLSFDKRLYKYDIAGSIAHCQMLAKQKIISQAELNRIKEALLDIGRRISEGRFKFDKADEDIHMAIERALVKKIGDAGKKMHTGRSRNDQVAADMRLWMRDEIETIKNKITLLQKAFFKMAQNYSKIVFPSYTHLQRAQPVVLAAYLLNFNEQFQRDFMRLDNCSIFLNVSPLGSGAIAGSTLGLDRNATAAQLGFSKVSRNSIDSVGDRDFCAEFIFDCALIAVHLSRLAEDWIIFSSNEFNFIHIDDKFCTSSSMMPQKRNPDMLELIRGKTGSIYGSLVGILTVLKGLPTGYNRDLQEDKIHTFTAADTIESCLDMACAIVSNTDFNIEEIQCGLDDGFLDATALAEYLVRKKIAFREAHGIVGQLVSHCEKNNLKLTELDLKEFKKFCPAIGKDVYDYLGADNVVNKYATSGAAGVKQTREQIAFWKNELLRR
jgi:argininosuccinate lyase